MTMSQTITVLGFDFGVKRFGVAIGQSITQSANPLKEIPAKDGIPDWQLIEKLIDEWQPDCFVTGLPLNMDGTESPMCKRARKFANRLHGRYGKPSHLWDERLSSQAVKSEHHSSDYKHNPVDSLAACLIIESWFSNTAS